MIVTLRPDSDADAVRRELVARGLWVGRVDGSRVQFLVEPCSATVDAEALRSIAGIEEVARFRSPTPRVGAQPRVVRVGAFAVGAGERPVVMAGLCAVESEEQIRAIARRLARDGVQLLRGGAFKPRTSPYSFQGYGAEALRWLRDAAREHGMAVVTEAMGADEVPLVAEHADLV